jgi:hypothetical protein
LSVEKTANDAQEVEKIEGRRNGGGESSPRSNGGLQIFTLISIHLCSRDFFACSWRLICWLITETETRGGEKKKRRSHEKETDGRYA